MIRRFPAFGIWVAIGLAMPVLNDFDTRRLALTFALVWVNVVALAHRRSVAVCPAIRLTAAVVLALGLISASLSPAPAWGYLEVGYTLLLVTAALALAGELRSSRIDYALVIAFGFVLPVALCSYAAVVIVYTSAISGSTMHYPEPLRHFANIRFFNQYQTWSLAFLPAALALASPTPRVRDRVWHAFVVGVAVFFWALFWRSSGRGTGYATLGATLLVGVLFGRAGRAHAAWTVALALLGLAACALMFGLGEHGAHLVSSLHHVRLTLWHIALTQIQAHPWFGIGPILFAGLDTGLASHPHDALLQWAVEWGVPAAILLGVTLTWTLYRWLADARAMGHRPGAAPPRVVAALAAAVLAGAAHALVSGVIVMPASQYMLVTVAALTIAVYRPRPARPHAARRVWPGRAVAAAYAAVVVACAAYVAVFTVHDRITRMARAAPETDAYNRNALQPRYWADGTLVPILRKPIPATVTPVY